MNMAKVAHPLPPRGSVQMLWDLDHAEYVRKFRDAAPFPQVRKVSLRVLKTAPARRMALVQRSVLAVGGRRSPGAGAWPTAVRCRCQVEGRHRGFQSMSTENARSIGTQR